MELERSIEKEPVRLGKRCWDDFLSTLDGVVLDVSVRDRMIWTPTAAGWSFKTSLECQSPVLPIWKVIWKVPTPLKIKTFILLLFKQRLPIREHLIRLQIVSAAKNFCPLCGAPGESFSHLFILCDQASSIWYQMAGFWEMSLVLPNDLHALFDWWMHVDLLAQRIMPWRLACYALMWTIWILCNRVTFHRPIFDKTTCLELFRFHFSW